MYDILSSRSKAKLLSMVNERLADGWKLVGGHTHVYFVHLNPQNNWMLVTVYD